MEHYKMLNPLKHYKLIVFDLDKTLVYPFTEHLTPQVKMWLKHYKTLKRKPQLAIATNKGNIGLNHWRRVVASEGGDIGQPDNWTEQDIVNQVSNVAREFGASYYISYRYQSKAGNWSPVPQGRENDPEWSKEWRKPGAGMLLAAMANAKAEPDQTLFVGDMETDKQAAILAGVDFMLESEFFEAYYPVVKIRYNPRVAWEWLTMRDEIDQAATEALYAKMLQDCMNYYGYKLELIPDYTMDTRKRERITIKDADSTDSRAAMATMISRSITDQWINRKWLKFSSPEAHLRSLMDGGFVGLLVVAPVYFRGLYTPEQLEQAQDALKEADSFKRRFHLVLG